jgi:cysteine-rich repeat protein
MSAIRYLLPVALLLGSIVHAPTAAFAVSTADEICAPTDDPCVISSGVSVDNGSVIDFGTRKVEVVPGGQIDIGAGSVTIRCGGFSSSKGSNNVAINARGPNGFGGTDGGDLTLEARRACSVETTTSCLDDADCALAPCDHTVCTGAPSRLCQADSGCQLGSCIPRFCSADPRRVCQSDGNCQLGVCQATHRCAGDNRTFCTVDADCNFGTCSLLGCENDSKTTCTDNADCNFGTCSTQVCAGDITRQCAGDADCDLGTCSVGTAEINIDAKILGQGEDPAIISIAAADDLEYAANINLNGTTIDSDGGSLDLQSTFGDVRMNGQVNATAGGNGTGGDVCAIAAGDIDVGVGINANGGDFDGGTVELDAGGNIGIHENVTADAVSGEGFGGEICMLAGTDITLVEGGATVKTTISAEGHTGTDGGSFGGDGGPHDISADRDVIIQKNTQILSSGASPDGYGETISIDAGRDVVVDGKLESKAKGGQGGGGAVEITSVGNTTISNLASIDVSGTSGGGGYVDISADGDLLFDAPVTAVASNGGTADSFDLASGGNMTIGPNADLTMSGTAFNNNNGTIDVDGCRMVVQSGALLENSGDFARNRFIVREHINFDAGSTVTADPFTGANEITYRNPLRPPVIDGLLNPAADLVLDEALQGCPVCGNAELEQGETCDDGNTVPGDGCSADCQDEGCIADTPGYPGTALCDDENGCTVDTCNTQTNSCDHVLDCDDGIDCTVDSCGAGNQCENLASNALCNDDNVCTDDVCNVASKGCLNSAISGPCDDGLACTSGDACNGGICIGSNNCPDGQSCNENTGQCVTGTTTTTTLFPPGCGDGVVTPPEECDDGDNVWVPGEACQADCGLVACADPDDTGTTSASDALFILRAAVGASFCDPCLCDVDNSGGNANASDALRTLRRSVGIPVSIMCPVCVP